MSDHSSVPAGQHAPVVSLPKNGERVWAWLTEELKGRRLPPLLLAVGLGEGELLEVLDARSPETRVLALEPDPVVAQRVLAQSHVEEWRRAGRLLYLAGPSYVGADEAWRLFPPMPDSYKVIVDPRLARGSEANLAAARLLKRIVFGVRANAEAKRRFAPMYLTNVLRNLPALANGHDIRLLANAFKDIPAIVAAAGPSLDTALDELAGAHNNGVLIAADTALRPLLTAGIAPHLAVGVDPSRWNARHFQCLPDCPDTWLVGESALAPSAAAVFDQRTFWFRVGDHQPWPWLKDIGISVGYVDVWGSVLTAAFQVACLAGCNPIVIVGADLAYTGGRPYCRGTTYEFDWASATAWGADLASSWQETIEHRKSRVVVDLHGRQTVSTESMLSFRDWMVARAKRSGRRVINATGAGILFGDGVQQGSLSALLQDESDIPRVADLAQKSAVSDRSALARSAKNVRDLVCEGRHSEGPVVQWGEFCGGAIDQVAVTAALDVALAALEPKEVLRVVATKTRANWANGEFTRGTIAHLPEAVIRFRAGLNGVALPDAIATHVATAQRPQLLREALDLLLEICNQAMKAEDVMPLRDLAGLSDYAVSGAYTWPEDIRWAVLAFEALLGRAWSPAVAASPRPYFESGFRMTGAAQAGGRRELPPNAAEACTALGEQWLRCLAGLELEQAAELRRLIVPYTTDLGQST